MKGSVLLTVPAAIDTMLHPPSRKYIVGIDIHSACIISWCVCVAGGSCSIHHLPPAPAAISSVAPLKVMGAPAGRWRSAPELGQVVLRLAAVC